MKVASVAHKSMCRRGGGGGGGGDVAIGGRDTGGVELQQDEMYIHEGAGKIIDDYMQSDPMQRRAVLKIVQNTLHPQYEKGMVHMEQINKLWRETPIFEGWKQADQAQTKIAGMLAFRAVRKCLCLSLSDPVASLTYTHMNTHTNKHSPSCSPLLSSPHRCYARKA
jgi:hypothetical protein